jgi:hypothetical protein
VSEEADTLDHLWTTPLSSDSTELRGDLQRVHDELRELLMSFIEATTMGDRQVRIARVYEDRVYQLYDMLKEIRLRHGLADR